jgi:hypothetical protein
MAYHPSPSSMLKESLDETLFAAKMCVEYRKTDAIWGEFQSNGCLGFPSAVLLFSIIDTIGSYYRKTVDFKIIIDGKSEMIDLEGSTAHLVKKCSTLQQKPGGYICHRHKRDTRARKELYPF